MPQMGAFRVMNGEWSLLHMKITFFQPCFFSPPKEKNHHNTSQIKESISITHHICFVFLWFFALLEAILQCEQQMFKWVNGMLFLQSQLLWNDADLACIAPLGPPHSHKYTFSDKHTHTNTCHTQYSHTQIYLQRTDFISYPQPYRDL